jgi:trehalose/maltose hydrolase-like predicted phosphorylase
MNAQTAKVNNDYLDEWTLRYDVFEPQHELVREALCTLGNGYFGTRGAAPESRADGTHYPGTYVTGLYNRRSTDVAGRSVENESMVNLPNWLPLYFRIDDQPWFEPGEANILDYDQKLNLRQAILTRRLRVMDESGRVTSVEQRRFVSMANPHIAGLEVTIRPENWSGQLTVRSGLDGSVRNDGVARYRQFDERHLVDHRTEEIDSDSIALAATTSQSGICVAEAARTRFEHSGAPILRQRCVMSEKDAIAHEATMEVSAQESVRIEKMICLFTSDDRSISDPLTEACSWIGRIGHFEQAFHDHAREWDDLWERFALEVDGCGPTAGQALHLHIFHLLQTASRNTIDRDVSVPARGVHGEAYRGHIFWDELFIYPYLNLHLPALVRSLLLYRYRRLPEARWAAKEVGLAGAMYPWQSGSNGREEAQSVHLNPLSGRWNADASHLQRHIGAAVAYNVWQYYEATGDMDFLATYGAEVIFEVARFWASIASYNPDLDRFEISGVMGPDEYHDGYVGADEPGLRNNTYTNVMAVWVLSRAIELLELLPEPRRTELRKRLSLDDDEIARWTAVSHKMRIVFHRDGIMSQFEGYEDLAELDWDGYRSRYGDIARLDRILESEGKTPNAYKASKQADVLMLFYLFSANELQVIFDGLDYGFDPDNLRRTIDYYLQRTSHGSTLSRVVHSWVLSRSDRERSLEFLADALRSDLDDVQDGTTGEGVHLGAMAGTVDLVQRCYLGIETRDNAIWFNPHLPHEIRTLSLTLTYRGRVINAVVEDDSLTVEIADWGDGTVRIGLRGTVAELKVGERHRIAV